MKNTVDYKSRFRILKGGKISLVISALVGSMTILSASPTGGIVTSGSANISQSGAVTNITQSTQKASINWQSFSIASNETVNFNQPNVNSITLNRVIGNERSIINGALNANGQVWILNSNGVLFGKSASINTAGLLATTAKLSDDNFNAGNYSFTDTTSNSVINQGTIEVSNDGYVVLASNEVRNEGTIKAVKGKIHLVGADSYTLDLNGNSLVKLTVNKGVLDALVKNSGTILADGGEIYLTTNAVDELLKGVVNNTGVIEANSIDDLTGYVELFAHGGTAQIGGSITALDGFVETSGKYYDFLGADIQAGEWLIDPVNITIDAALASAIESALGSGDVTIQTGVVNTPATTLNESGEDGHIYVNSDIAWNANTLTISAARSIYVNAIMSVTGTGGVAFNYADSELTGNLEMGFNADGTFKGRVDLVPAESVSINGTPYFFISNPNSLQNINNYLSLNWVLGNNLNLSGIDWTPIGNSVNNFTGNFNGLGHTVSNLTVTSDYAGLFGVIDGSAEISNVGVTNANVTGTRTNVGILVSTIKTNTNKIYNTYTSGTVSSGVYANIGGLVGSNFGTIENSHSFATVVAESDSVGGLVGDMSGGYIKNSYATGSVTGTLYVGGLVGGSWTDNASTTATISNSYATGVVTGTDKTGGLVGQSSDLIESSYATGSVNGVNKVGGFIGVSLGTITNSYSTGSVSGTAARVGGLVGHGLGTITNSYATGRVNGNTLVGGLVGASEGLTITNSFWDTETTGQANSNGGTGKTTAEMKTLSTFTGWNISEDGGFYPTLTIGGNTIWTMGVAPTQTPTPTPTQTPTPEPTTESTSTETDDIVTAIINDTVTQVALPKMLVNTPKFVKNVGQKNNPQLNTNQEVRVPLYKNSIIELLNGGVKLPDGVEQQFFVVADEKKGVN